MFQKLVAKEGIESISYVAKSSIDSIAIGKFDGLHLAHKELFSRLTKDGAILVIDNQDSILTPNRYKYRFTNLPIFLCSFDAIRFFDGRVFVEYLKSEFPNLKKIVVGYDFRFGNGRDYCAQDLSSMFDGVVEIVDEVRVGNISVHSGIIKELIRYGDIKEANRLLGRDYTIFGIPIRGQQIGKKELYATINLCAKEFLMPIEGVYISLCELDGESYHSVCFVGHRVSTDRKFSIEVHILDREIECECDLVGVSFLKKIRDNHKYLELDKLRERISKDINEAREFFKN